MTDTKTFVIPEGGAYGGNNGLDPNLLFSMNGGGFGGGAFNNPIWALIFLAVLGNNYGGFGGGGNSVQLSQIQDTLNTNQGNTLLMDAIKGNQTAIGQLSQTIGCNYNAVQAAINGVQSAICNIGARNDMSAMQIVNAINSGDSMLANQLSSCCCDVKMETVKMGYENQINNLNQSNMIQKGFGDVAYATQAQTTALAANADANAREIASKIDAQTTLINDKFCQLELRSLQDKLAQERDKNLALTNQLSQEHQNATFAAIVAPIKADVEEIKCKQPATVTVPYSPITPVPSCVAWNAALYGGFPYAQQGSVFS